LATDREIKAAKRRGTAIEGKNIDHALCIDEEFLEEAVEKAEEIMRRYHEEDGERVDVRRSNVESFVFRDTGSEIFGFGTPVYGFSKKTWAYVHRAQDFIEYMFYLDREEVESRRMLSETERPPASIAVTLHDVLRAGNKPKYINIILAGVSPRIVADLIHYAAVGTRNQELAYYIGGSEAQTKAILRKIYEAQSDKRKTEIDKHLTEQARLFIQKKESVRDQRRQEKTRRKKLRLPASTSSPVGESLQPDDRFASNPNIKKSGSAKKILRTHEKIKSK